MRRYNWRNLPSYRPVVFYTAVAVLFICLCVFAGLYARHIQRRLDTPMVVTVPAAPYRTFMPPATAQAPTSNTAAVATLKATAGGQWNISAVRWSYSATPTGGLLTIAWTDAGSVTRSEVYYVTAAGPNSIRFDPPLSVESDVAPTVTLAAGGSGILGTVYVTASPAARGPS